MAIKEDADVRISRHAYLHTQRLGGRQEYGGKAAILSDVW
jgi:hypothetical protein